MDRLARLKGMVEENPQDRFARYGLAMELASQGRLEESLGEFRALMSWTPTTWPVIFKPARRWKN